MVPFPERMSFSPSASRLSKRAPDRKHGIPGAHARGLAPGTQGVSHGAMLWSPAEHQNTHGVERHWLYRTQPDPKNHQVFQDNNPGQPLITTNRRFEHLFEKPDETHIDTAQREGIYWERNGKKIDLLWVPPKLAGTDIYKDMTNVAFFAAMRPGGDEVAFVLKSLLITETDVIRWREYNTLFQFVMRICLWKFKSGEVANVYFYDEWQAEYLRERFGGCLEYRQIANVFRPVKISKGGGSKPKAENGEVKSALERKHEQTPA
jgi:hypothetical protein